MPESGGPTTQSGILYQNSVAALALGRLCDARQRPPGEVIVRVRVEAPYHVDDIVIEYSDPHTEYVQAKENIRVGDEIWRGLWENIAKQFQRKTFARQRDLIVVQLGTPSSAAEALRELCERAANSESVTEWTGRLNAAQQSMRSAVERSLPPEFGGASVVMALLSHIRVHVFTLDDIERERVNYWMPPASTSPKTLFRLLRDRVGGKSRVRGSFDASTLRASLLKENNVELREPIDEESMRSAVRATGSVLQQYKQTFGATGIHLSRPVVDEMVEWVMNGSGNGRVGLLFDGPGYGKTVALREVFSRLNRTDVPAIAIKADQQLSRVANASDVHSALGLPYSVESVVSRLAVSGRVVVIIDQIDALSLSMARDQRTLDVVLDLIGRLRQIPGVALLISCREFDRNTDPRLKRLETNREFRLDPLSHENIESVLLHLGVDVGKLSPATLELLRVPLHLDLFSTLAATSAGWAQSHTALGTLQDLYTELWDALILRQSDQTSSPETRVRVLKSVVDRMNAEQRTSVVRASIGTSSEASAAAAWLASHGILIFVAAQVTFLHQTFFDYCFARFFVEAGRDLAAETVDSEQGLFARSKIVQVLSFLRSADQPRYGRALLEILSSARIRPHIRNLTIQWLGSVASPSELEWRIARRMLAQADSRERMLPAFGTSKSWFALMREGPLQGYLRGDAQQVDWIIQVYLIGVADACQDELAEIVEGWMTRGPLWERRVRHVLRFVRVWSSPRMIQVLNRCVTSIPFAELRMVFIDLKELLLLHPNEGLEVLEKLLQRVKQEFMNSCDASHRYRGIGRELGEIGAFHVSQALEEARLRIPKEFARVACNWIAEVAELEPSEGKSSETYGSDPLARMAYEPDEPAVESFLQNTIASLVALHSTDSVTFAKHLERLERIPVQTPQLIVAKVLARLSAIETARIVAFLIQDRRRLRLGQQTHGEVTRELLTAVGPVASAAEFSQIEDAILQHSGKPWRSSIDISGLRWRGQDQLALLRSLPRARLSAKGLNALGQLERKFPTAVPLGRSDEIEGGFVRSPIDADKLDRMSDRDWLRAIAKYSRGVRHPSYLRGGASQLAAELKQRVKTSPARFLALAMQFPADVDPTYVQAIAHGVADGKPSDEVFAFLEKYAGCEDPHVVRAVAHATQRLMTPDREVDPAMIAGFQKWVVRPMQNDETEAQSDFGDPYNRSINSVRGEALAALLEIRRLSANPEAMISYWATVDDVARDPSDAFVAAALFDLCFALRKDAEKAVRVFEALVDGRPALRNSESFVNFLYWASQKRFNRLSPYLHEAMDAPSAHTAQRAAAVAMVYHVSPSILEDDQAKAIALAFANECTQGREEWRLGAAEVLARNACDLDQELFPLVERLFDDPSEKVRSHIAGLTHQLREDLPGPQRNLLLCYAASASLWPGLYSLSEFLFEDRSSPEWSLGMVRAILENRTTPANEWSALHGGENLVRTVLRTLADPLVTAEVRREALDLFDLLIDRYAVDASKAVAEWDRR